MRHTSVVVFKNNHKRRMEMFKPTQLLKYKFYHFYFLKEVALQVAIVLYPAAFALRCFFFAYGVCGLFYVLNFMFWKTLSRALSTLIYDKLTYTDSETL